jgi:vacuolar-type H+-ATPase subunit E/Vma4
MGLPDVKAAIQEKTKSEIAVRLEEAKTQAEKIISEAQEQVKLKQQMHKEKTQELLDAMERRETAAANFTRKSILLAEKRKAIEEVFQNVATAVQTMSKAERNKMLMQLAQKASDAIDVTTVHANNTDIQTLTKAFPKAKIVADDKISGGFIADDQTGTVRIDYTIDTLLSAVREQHMAELTKLLFA